MYSQIESIGLHTSSVPNRHSTIELIQKATQDCLLKSNFTREEISVLVNTSTYHFDHIGEPAYASFIQKYLDINPQAGSSQNSTTFSFDMLNGALGFLNGIQSVGAIINAPSYTSGLVVSGDVINRQEANPDIVETGAAMLLKPSASESTGFGSFYFQEFPEYSETKETYMYFRDNKLNLAFTSSQHLESIYCSCMVAALHSFCDQYNYRIKEFDWIIPPQISSQFIDKTAKSLEIKKDKCVDLCNPDGDLFNASVPAGLKHLLDNNMLDSGDKVLIIAAGSGIQVGCAVYRA